MNDDRDSDGNITEEEDDVKIKNLKLKEANRDLSLTVDLTCRICLEIFTHPYTLLPCLHTFDKECIQNLWENDGFGRCPLCKEATTSARFSYTMNGLTDRHRQARGIPPPETPTSGSKTTEEIFPDGRRGTQNDSDTDDEDDIEMGSFDDGVMVPTPPPLLFSIPPEVHGSLQPCPACLPDNPTGYTCPHPLSAPDAPPSLPLLRAQARVSILNADMTGFRSEAATHHRHCDACTAYIPLNGPPSQCCLCKRFTCNSIYPDLCPRVYNVPTANDPQVPYEMRLQNLQELEASLSMARGASPAFLWQLACEPPLRDNLVEKQRFVDYFLGNPPDAETAFQLFVQSYKRALRDRYRAPPPTRSSTTSQDAAVASGRLLVNVVADNLTLEAEGGRTSRPAPPTILSSSDFPTTDEQVNRQDNSNETDPDARLRVCMSCSQNFTKTHFYEWWRNERSQGHLDPAIANLPHCWYGRECRTGRHNTHHAETYNHICENTSVARGRAQAGAIP